MTQAYIYDAVRTPRGKGKKDGSLHEITGLSLASQQLAALRCITAGVAMHGFMQDPDTTIRTALFMDQAIQRHAALAEELAAWEALPDSSGFSS